MIIGHIGQLLLDKLSNIYWTESKVSNEYLTLDPPNISQFNIPWTICPRYKTYVNNEDLSHCQKIIGYIVQ